MCGIIGYIGEKEANKILLAGLERLEYRGYDSAGLAIIDNAAISINKVKGRVNNLKSSFLPGNTGIGHTRWATHGQPSLENAHPFMDEKKQFALVHNGIIENHLELKEELRKEGVTFSSETDSEVIVHLIARNYTHSLREAVLKTVWKLKGAYAFCIIKNDRPEIVGAKNGSPLIVGLGDHEHFLASDVSAIVEHTKTVVYLDDFEIAQITKDQTRIFDFHGQEKPVKIKQVDWDLEQAQKGGFKHFMLKEIFEQPQVAEHSLLITPQERKDYQRVFIVACGGASFAGLLGKYIIEEVAKIPVYFDTGSEFRYRQPLYGKDDLVMAISQSGETADTLAAVRIAKERGARTLSIINVVGSTIARESDEVIYTKAGPEISVASTKAFLAQIITVYQLAFHFAGKEFSFPGYPQIITGLLHLNETLRELAKKYYLHQNFIYIARNRNYPIAMEGALKLKEIAYIHAEPYPAGELKHGPLALVCEEMPTFAICPMDEFHDKTISNIEEIKSRRGKIIILGTEGDQQIQRLADDVIYMPKVDPLFYPLIETVPVHLFAYHIADLRECDIDKPRNLAKSVTVE